jgi:opacity protein-like surface antigen
MLNKKLLALGAALSVALVGVANAGAFDDTRFNVGGEISVFNRTAYNNTNTSDLNNFKTSNSASKLAIRKNKPGVNVFLGARFNEYVGAEVGFGFIQQVKANVQNNRTATNKISNIYADLLGYANVAPKVDLIGSVGIGMLKSKSSVPGATFVNQNALNKGKVGVRLGVGAQYNFDTNWAARAMFRYQKGNTSFLKSNTSVSVGALYIF